MITRYDSEVEDITFETPEELLQRLLGDSGAGARRALEGYSETTLRHMWRAEAITEEQWKAELVARGASEQQAATEIAISKGVGLSTAAATKGQLTASEAAAVAAVKASTPAAAATPPAAPSTAGAFNQPTGMPTSLQARAQQARSVGTNPLVPEGSQPAVGPAGRTVAQIKGTEYLSDAERAWYLQQTSGTSDAASRAATASGSSSGTAAVPAKPKGPIPGSKEDLLLKGGIPVGSNITLQGQQYRDTTVVVQADDGKYYVVDKETGAPVSGPYNTSAEAGRNAPLTQLGPAITSNDSARIGSMAQAGAGRPLVSPSSGMDAALSLDQIIASTAQRGFQPGDFMGAAQTDFGPVDIARGGIPDYGGMRPVTDPTGDATGYTGRIGTPNGEIAIGTSAINQDGTQYGSQIQTVLAPYLSQSQINRIDPAKYDQIALAVNALRESGQLQQADTAATKGLQAGNYTALGFDPYDVELFPDVPAYKHGGSLMLDEPTFMVEASGNIVGVAAEGGNKEKVEQQGNSLQFTPMKGKAKYHGGMMTDALGVPDEGRMLIGGQARTGPYFGPSTPPPPEMPEEEPFVGTLPSQGIGIPDPAAVDALRARREQQEAEAAAKAAVEKAALVEAQRAMAQAAQDAYELRGRQFEAGRFNAAGMPAPLTISPQFGDAWQYLNSKDASKLFNNRGQAPLGTQWPVGLRPPSSFNPQEIGQQAYRRALESAQGRRRINGSGGMGGYRPSPDDIGFEGPLPGPQPNLPTNPYLNRGEARRWGISPLQMRGWGVAARKAPIGAGLQPA